MTVPWGGGCQLVRIVSAAYRASSFSRGKEEGDARTAEAKPTAAHARTDPPLGTKKRPATFSHPDCTVGPGVTPDPEDLRRTCLPWDDSFSGLTPSRAFRSPLAGFTADRELGSSLPSPCPEGRIFSSEEYIAREGIGAQAAWWVLNGSWGNWRQSRQGLAPRLSPRIVRHSATDPLSASWLA